MPIEFTDGNNLKVTSIFDTIQGEGPYSGCPATFVRLSGCNLSCDFCDTEFESYNLLSVNEITKQISSNNNQLVVITGGEPFRQNIHPLCNKLLGEGLKIQIESNGTVYRDIPKEVGIVCSPKLSNGIYHLISEPILKQAIAIKFLVSTNIKGYDKVHDLGQKKYNIPVYIQPIDQFNKQQNQDNMNYAINIAKKTNSILSLQLHKILRIR